MAWKKHKQYRLPGYDYAAEGAYFLTIVCKDRQSFLGSIDDGQFYPTDIGAYLEHLLATLDQKIDWCTVEEYQVMPNHVHIILLIRQHAENKEWKAAEGLQPLRKQSASSFCNHLKGKLTRWCREQNHPGFDWQARFHDRVIRNGEEYEAITNYVRNNVANWKEDR